jgi:hypothetical protein
MITGNWELERKLTDDMGPLLKLMGRPSWQSNIINKANETFQVTVMKITNEDKKQCHIVEKSVCIFLDSKILKWVEKFARTISKDIDYTRVRYKHRFIDTQGKVFMGDDEKHLYFHYSHFHYSHFHELHFRDLHFHVRRLQIGYL